VRIVDISRMPVMDISSGARDRRRRHRQHVHRGAQRLEVLLVLDAEALLLVDDRRARGP
jgi:hypothetical protein